MKKPHEITWLVLGPLLFLLIWNLPVMDLSAAQRGVLGLTLWMMIWWISEAVPLFVTSLVPMLSLPVVANLKLSEISPVYASEVIFLFFGGFVLSIALEKWEVHRQIATRILPLFGRKPQHLLLGFMLITAALSMWISNTACAFMMLPIALAVARSCEASGRSNLEKALLFGVAYSASIGGIASLIGSPPNAILVGYLRERGIELSFLDWLKFGLPLSIIFLGILWLYLRSYFFRESGCENLKLNFPKSKNWNRDQKRVLVLFVLTAACWILRPILNVSFLSDAGIAIGASVLFFILHSSRGRLLEAPDIRLIPWDILLLFGGGLALAKSYDATGLSPWIGQQLTVLSDWPELSLYLALCTIVIFFTEIGSNTAVASLFIPLIGALSLSLGTQDDLGLLIAGTLSASFAFMLPMATPPNAIIFHSDKVKMAEMAKIGFALNIIGVLILSFIGRSLLQWVL